MIGCLVPQRWRPSLDQSLCECWLKPALFRLWHVVLGPNLLCFLLTFSPLCSLHLHICLHDCLHVSVCRGVVHFCVCRCGRHGDQILRRDVVYLSPQMSVLYVDHLKVGQGAEPSASELYQLLSLCSPSWTQTTNRFCPGQQNIYSHVVVCVCGGGGSSTVQVFMLGLCRQPRCFSLCVNLLQTDWDEELCSFLPLTLQFIFSSALVLLRPPPQLLIGLFLQGSASWSVPQTDERSALILSRSNRDHVSALFSQTAFRKGFDLVSCWTEVNLDDVRLTSWPGPPSEDVPVIWLHKGSNKMFLSWIICIRFPRGISNSIIPKIAWRAGCGPRALTLHACFKEHVKAND